MATIVELEAQIKEFNKLKFEAAEREEFAKASEYKKKVIELEEKLKKLVEDDLKIKKQRVEKIEAEVQVLKNQKYEAAEKEDFILAGKIKNQIIELEKELSGNLQFIQTYEKPVRKETANAPPKVENISKNVETPKTQTRPISPSPSDRAPMKEGHPTNVRTQSSIKLVAKNNTTQTPTTNISSTKAAQSPTITPKAQTTTSSTTNSQTAKQATTPATKQTQLETQVSKQSSVPAKQPTVTPEVVKQTSTPSKQVSTVSAPQKATQTAPTKAVSQVPATNEKLPVKTPTTTQVVPAKTVSNTTQVATKNPSNERVHKLTLVVSPTTISVTPDGAKSKPRKTESGNESTKDKLLAELDIQKKNYQEVHRSTETLVASFSKAMQTIEQIKQDVSRLQQEQALIKAAVSNV